MYDRRGEIRPLCDIVEIEKGNIKTSVYNGAMMRGETGIHGIPRVI